MGLSDDLHAVRPKVGGRTPRVDALLEELKGEDRAALLRALEDPERVSAPALAAVLKENGHKVSHAAIKRWRQGRLVIQ